MIFTKWLRWDCLLIAEIHMHEYIYIYRCMNVHCRSIFTCRTPFCIACNFFTRMQLDALSALISFFLDHFRKKESSLEFTSRNGVTVKLYFSILSLFIYSYFRARDKKISSPQR